jgi:hypothetical protein
MTWEIAMVTSSIGVLWYFAILMIHTDDSHMPLKFFYLIASMWLMVANLNLALQLAIDNTAPDAITNTLQAIYTAGIWTAYVVSAYFILYYIYLVIKNSAMLAKMRSNGK